MTVDQPQRVFAPPDQRLQQDLGVGVRLKLTALGDQALAQLDVVVDLPVEHDPVSAGDIRHGLFAHRDVDDRQTGGAETGVLVEVVAELVRAAVPDDLEHPFKPRGVLLRGAGEPDKAYDSAHQTLPRLPESDCRAIRPNLTSSHLTAFSARHLTPRSARRHLKAAVLVGPAALRPG